MILIGTVLAVLLPLQQRAWNDIDARIRNANPAVALGRFVGYPAGANADRFELNPSFWAKGIDFSCVSPWNSGSGTLRAGTLISNRHIIFARHFALAKGVRIVFVGEDGGVCPCNVEDTKAIKNSDVMIGLLNVEVTPNIHPAKILPVDYEKYIGDGNGLPVGTFNQRERLLLTVADALPTNGAPVRGISSRVPEDRKRAQFREKVIVGDSGDPAFLLLCDQAVLAYCVFSGGAGAGPAPHMYRREIQATMDELCPGYKLEEFDFTKGRRKDEN